MQPMLVSLAATGGLVVKDRNHSIGNVQHSGWIPQHCPSEVADCSRRSTYCAECCQQRHMVLRAVEVQQSCKSRGTEYYGSSSRLSAKKIKNSLITCFDRLLSHLFAASAAEGAAAAADTRPLVFVVGVNAAAEGDWGVVDRSIFQYPGQPKKQAEESQALVDSGHKWRATNCHGAVVEMVSLRRPQEITSVQRGQRVCV